MSIRKRIADYIRAGYAGLFITSHEEARIKAEIAAVANDLGYSVYVWTVTSSLMGPLGDPEPKKFTDPTNQSELGPDGLLRYMCGMLPKKSIVLAMDFHLFTGESNPYIIRLGKDCLTTARANMQRLIVLGCQVKLCPELEKEFTVVNFDLPGREELGEVLKEIADSAQVRLNGNTDKIIDSACGMTTMEAADAFALAVVESGGDKIPPEIVAREKSNVVKKNGLLEIVESSETINDVGGNDGLKEWILKRKNAFSKEAKTFGLPIPRGALLVGIPGCLHGDTPIYDPVKNTTLTAYERWQDGGWFHVVSATTQGFAASAAAPVVRFHEQEMIRFDLSNGESITVTEAHRFLTKDGWLTADKVYELTQESVPVLLASNSEPSREALRRDERSLIHTDEGLQSGYQNESCSCGEQSPQGPNTSQDGSPSRACAHEHSPHGLHADGLDSKPGRSHSCPPLAPLSTMDSSDQSEEGESLSNEEQRTPSLEMCPGVQRSPAEAFPNDTEQPRGQSDPKSIADEGLDVRIQAYRNFCSWVSVVKCEKVGSQTYYDFHVPVWNNYVAAGVVNHNCGKTQFGRVIANVLNIPLLKLDAGKIFAGLVGQSESNLRSVIQTVEAVAPCVLLVDEIEKGLSGSKSSGQTDGGTSARVFGTFLQWMNDKKSAVFVVATANDISQLPPEFLRKGRFDELFFADLPNADEREQIFKIHISKQKRDASKFNLTWLAEETNEFTGSEIEAVVIDALYIAFDRGTDLNEECLKEAIGATVPLSRTMSAQVTSLREWARNRTRPCSKPKPSKTIPAGRRIEM